MESESISQKNSQLMELGPQNESHSNVWLDKMRKGNLTTEDFKEYWRATVLKVCDSKHEYSAIKCKKEVEQCQKLIYSTLEEFICDGHPMSFLQKLREIDDSSAVCCRALKSEEPRYKCLDCSTDGTRVLCVHCLMRSPHRNHDYKIFIPLELQSYCDCGNVDAWKSEPFCDFHLVSSQNGDSKGDNYPEGMRERVEIAFKAVVEFCMETLLDDSQREYSAEGNESTDEYCIIIYCNRLENMNSIDDKLDALSQSVKLSKEEALDIVDKVYIGERVVVKIASYQLCKEVKDKVDINCGKLFPLSEVKTLVIPVAVAVHQRLALKLIPWLDDFVTYCREFQRIFKKISLDSKILKYSYVERFFLNHECLWRRAQDAWQHLFISGLILEYETRNTLAEMYLQHYASIIPNVARRDYTFLFKIHLFTIPKMALHLIAHCDAISVILNVAIGESADDKDLKRIYQTSSYPWSMPTELVFADLKTLFRSKPEVWTDELRQAFLKGVSLLLKLVELQSKYGDVHMVDQPQISRLANEVQPLILDLIITVVDWCRTDRIVFVKVFEYVLEHLKPYEDKVTEVKKLVNHSATCIKFDVFSEPVSAYLPLSHFFAGLYLLLDQYDLKFHRDFGVFNKLTPEEMFEPVLRRQIFISQMCNAPVDELVDIYSELLLTPSINGDIVLLQIGASFVESNEFMIHFLNKFNLLDWASPDYKVNASEDPEGDGAVNKTNAIVDDFLKLLVYVVGERYMVGVGQVTREDSLKRAIIQELCLKSLSRFELDNLLNRGLRKYITCKFKLDSIMDDVAVYKNRGFNRRGIYELKPALYAEFNFFYYNYTKWEMESAEQVQRNRLVAAGEPVCFPPPKLPKLTTAFTLLANLLQCDVMLRVMQTVLQRALHSTDNSFLGFHVHKVLHLIGYALQEEESGYYPFFHFSEKALQLKIHELMQDLLCSAKVEIHEPLLTWTLSKFKDVTGVSAQVEPASDESKVPVNESPEKEPSTTVAAEKKDVTTSQMVAERKQKIMAQMLAMQKKFLETYTENPAEESFSPENDSTTDVANSEDSLLDLADINLAEGKIYTCIICQEDESLSAFSLPMVCVAYVQRSTFHHPDRCRSVEPSSDNSSAYLRKSVHASTCGHAMHVSCWQKYSRETQAINRARSFKAEYVCGMCRSLSNTFIPLVPSLPPFQPTDLFKLSFQEWVTAWIYSFSQVQLLDQSSVDRAEMQDFGNEDVHMRKIRLYMEKLLVEKDNESIPRGSEYLILDELKKMINTFARDICSKYLGLEIEQTSERIPFLLLNTITYSIHDVQSALRDTKRPLFGSFSLRERETLASLSTLSTILLMAYTNPTKESEKADVSSLTMMIFNKLLTNPHDSENVLNWDSFSVFMTLVNLMPFFAENESAHIMTTSDYKHYLLKLVFISLVVKILISTDYEEIASIECDSEEKEENEGGCDSILKLAEFLKVDVNNLSAVEVWRHVKKTSLPFVRCCALYFHFVTEDQVPVVLSHEKGDTFENICQYIGLSSNCNELLGADVVGKLALTWAEHPGPLECPLTCKKPLPVEKFVDLPEDYNELIEATSSFVCPNGGMKATRKPVMCLLCGVMLCDWDCNLCTIKYKVNACTHHEEECGAGYNVFFNVILCSITFFRHSIRWFYRIAPYADQYGQSGMQACQGNPLRLCRKAYEKLNQLWLKNRIFELNHKNFHEDDRHPDSDDDDDDDSD